MIIITKTKTATKTIITKGIRHCCYRNSKNENKDHSQRIIPITPATLWFWVSTITITITIITV